MSRYKNLYSKSYTGFYKRYTDNDAAIYFVVEKIDAPRISFYNVIRYAFPGEYKMSTMTHDNVTYELCMYDWNQIEEAEYLLSKVT